MRFWPYAIAAPLAALAVYVDFRSGEPAVTAPMLAVFAGAMGLAQPQSAWRWGLLFGLAPFIGYALAGAVGYRPPAGMPDPNLAATLLALPFGFGGAYAGSMVRRATLGPDSSIG